MDGWMDDGYFKKPFIEINDGALAAKQVRSSELIHMTEKNITVNIEYKNINIKMREKKTNVYI